MVLRDRLEISMGGRKEDGEAKGGGGRRQGHREGSLSKPGESHPK